MLNSSMNPELQALLDRISALESALNTANTKIDSLEDRDYIVEQTSEYTRYKKGMLICHFSHTILAGFSGAQLISFPKKFKDTNYTVSVTLKYSGNNWTSPLYVTSKDSSSGFRVYKYSSPEITVEVIAIGRWK